MCASAVVMLDTPCFGVLWRVLATHSIRQFSLHFPSRASPCAITFQLESTPVYSHNVFVIGIETCSDLLTTKGICLPTNKSCVHQETKFFCFMLENTRGWQTPRLSRNTHSVIGPRDPWVGGDIYIYIYIYIYQAREDSCERNSGEETEGKVHLENLDIDRTWEVSLNLIY
jgi:hypothetical protein